MSLNKIHLYYFIFLGLNFRLRTVSGIENQKCIFELAKHLPKNNVQNIEFKIDTSLKQETINSREILSDLIKKEFARLVATVNAQRTELTNMKKELNGQREFIKNELNMEREKYQDYISRKIEAVCVKNFVEQNQKLSENMIKNFSQQEKTQEKLIENALKRIEYPRYHDKLWDINFNCTRNCGPIMDLPNNCEEAMTSSSSGDGGVYLIKIENSELKPFYAYCERIENEVWTIIQRREDGSVDFYRNWSDYKYGFGNLYGEFWLGLERLHAMTNQRQYELQIWLEKKNGAKAYAHYGQFLIASEAEKYKLTVADYSGNAGNDLLAINTQYRSHGSKFSTHDNCNDNHDEGYDCCAGFYKGAWWFNKCYISHLNGPYNSTTKDGVDWNSFEKKLKYTQMGIRPVLRETYGVKTG